GGIGQGFSGAALFLDGVSRCLDVQRCEPAVFVETEAGNRIVAAIGGKQKPSIRREDHTPRALEGVRGALLAANRLERSGPGAPCRTLSPPAAPPPRRPVIVNGGVPDLVRLHVRVPATRVRFAHLRTATCLLGRSKFCHPTDGGRPGCDARHLLKKCSTTDAS